jgi:aspartate aminotransferase-like enzyme
MELVSFSASDVCVSAHGDGGRSRRHINVHDVLHLALRKKFAAAEFSATAHDVHKSETVTMTRTPANTELTRGRLALPSAAGA